MKARILIAAVLLAVGVSQLYAATITVTSINDSGPGTLRFALANAADGDTIDASGISGTILLTNGELLISNSVTILGPGPNDLAVDGNAASRVFHINTNATVTISSLTITNGAPVDRIGGGIFNDHATLTVSNCTVSGNSAGNYGYGGGIDNDGGTLTIVNSTISSNSAHYYGSYGGGIFNDEGTLTITNSTVSGNSAEYGYGGGIDNDGGTLTIVNSTISSNTASGNYGRGYGGGIDNEGSEGNATLTVSNCTLSGNSAGSAGGGIFNDEGTLTIANSTISSNSADDGGGGIDNDGGTLTIVNSTISSNSADDGGGIDNDEGTLTIVNSTISSNSAYYNDGGGIDNEGYEGNASLTVSNCTLSGNSAGYGGGIFNDGGTLTIANSTISSNSAYYYGGGIDNEGYEGNASLTIANSTISSNSSYHYGGGIFNYGIHSNATLTIVNSTVSGNSATVLGNSAYYYYGGIYNDAFLGNATLTIVNSTVSGNSAAGVGVGIYNEGYEGNAALVIGSTILNAGASGGTITNVSGTVTSLGYNLSSDDGGGFLTATGDQTNTDPMLGPLQDNGGPTFTCALLPGSPAINAGDPNFTPPPDFDQRGPGFPRVVCGRIDIGAFEVQDAPVITCPANIVTDATSPMGAVVYFKPTAVDECSSISISSTPRSGSLFAIGDTTVSCLAANATGNQASCSFTVHVKGAAEQIADLIVLVRSFNLKPWTTYILTAELQFASNALRRGNVRAACGDLDVFIFEVDVQTWWGQIRPLPRARLLVRDAQRIQNVLGCRDRFGYGRP